MDNEHDTHPISPGEEMPGRPGMEGLYPKLYDEWDSRGIISLNGWLERNKFHPVLMAFLVGVFAFFLYQAVGAAFMLTYVLLTGGLDAVAAGEDPSRFLLLRNPQMLLLGNAIGQILGLALPVLIIVRLHTRSVSRFLRFRKPDPGLFLLSMAGVLALMPIVHWLASFSDLLPMPDWLDEFERMQLELIERVLMHAGGWIVNLVLIAMIPSLCEEVLFRGYLQRQMERVAGIAGGILITGVIFGLFHLRPTQLLPLAILGIYIGYTAWRSGSLWSAVGAHFLNNAVAVSVAAYVATRTDIDLAAMEDMTVPWYYALPAVIIFVFIITAMNQRARKLLAGRDNAGERVLE